MTKNIDEHFMEIALEQAQISLTDGNFPVGAVLVIDGVEIGRSRNLLSINSDWISHIELNSAEAVGFKKDHPGRGSVLGGLRSLSWRYSSASFDRSSSSFLA
ncbi:MAG: hypothetical protein M1459_02165 [Patescibacteria group bacterium]|nr:hypothetical protein [Patescibacteria group bacterium]